MATLNNIQRTKAALYPHFRVKPVVDVKCGHQTPFALSFAPKAFIIATETDTFQFYATLCPSNFISEKKGMSFG